MTKTKCSLCRGWFLKKKLRKVTEAHLLKDFETHGGQQGMERDGDVRICNKCYIKVRVAAGSNTRKVSQITEGMMSTGDGQESLELGDSVADNSPPLNGTGREDASANGF
jgi:hypothetical protein